MSPRNPRSQIHQGSSWILHDTAEGVNATEASVSQIADFIQANSAALNTLEDCAIELRIGVFSESWQTNFELPKSILRKLDSVSMDILFSVYGSSKSES